MPPGATVLAGPDTTTDVSTSGACTVSDTESATVTVPAVAASAIVTDPGATPVTSPLGDTVARLVFRLVQASVAANVAPVWSRAVPVSCSVCPTAKFDDGAEMPTVVSTGGAAVMESVRVAETVTPPAAACAVITADPAASAVTSPVCDTDAIVGAFVDHVTVAAIAAPFWSRAAATSWSVWPTCTEAVAGVMETEVSTGVGADTVTAAVPVTVVLPTVASAEIVAPPTAIAVTRPEVETVAMVGADVDQAADAVIAAPFWSRAVAVI